MFGLSVFDVLAKCIPRTSLVVEELVLKSSILTRLLEFVEAFV